MGPGPIGAAYPRHSITLLQVEVNQIASFSYLFTSHPKLIETRKASRTKILDAWGRLPLRSVEALEDPNLYSKVPSRGRPQSYQNVCVIIVFYNEKAVEACIEAGLDEPRSMVHEIYQKQLLLQ